MTTFEQYPEYLIKATGISRSPLELHLTTSELWFGQEQEGILP